MSINNILHPGEKIQKHINPHPLSYFGWYIFGGILVLVVIGIPILIIIEMIRKAHDYYITDKRIIYDFTFLSRKVSSVVYRKITDIHFTQNLVQRLFKIGNVHINTAGGESIEVKFKGIKNPGLITNFIQKHMIR